MTLTQEDIQKQIEAVRGLIITYKEMQIDVDCAAYLFPLCSTIRTLTETLKPYLSEGQKLEV